MSEFIQGFAYGRILTLNQFGSVVFWPYWSDLCQIANAYCKTVNCIARYPQCLTIQAAKEPEFEFQVGDTVRIYGGHIRYRISSFNTKDFPEPHASLRAGCTGCWCPVSKLRRWDK